MRLFQYILDRNPNGITLDDAEQLCLLLYCTLDPLPQELRKDHLGGNELADIFAKLAQAGRIIGTSLATEHPASRMQVEIAEPMYWKRLIDKLLRKEILLDPEFQANRACHYI